MENTSSRKIYCRKNNEKIIIENTSFKELLQKSFHQRKIIIENTLSKKKYCRKDFI